MSKYEIKNIGPASIGQIVSIHYALQGGRDFLDTKGVKTAKVGDLAIWEIQQSWNPEGSYDCGWTAKGGGAFELLNILLNTEAQPLVGYLKSCPKVVKPKAYNKAAAPKGLMVEKPKASAAQPPVAVPVAAPQQDRIDRLEALLLEMLDRQTAPQSVPVPAEPVAPQPTAGHQMQAISDGMVVMSPNGEMLQLVMNPNGTFRTRKTIV